MFHRQFPDRFIDRYVISSIMRKAGLQKKVIKVQKAPRRYELNLEKFGDQIIELDLKIQGLYKSEHLVFADECIFTAKGYQNTAWSNTNENITVTERMAYQPC